MPCTNNSFNEEVEVNKLLQEDNSCSDLYIAAQNGNLPAIRAMIQAGADVNHPNSALKLTPLYGAIYAGHVKVIKELIDAGADPNWKSAYNETSPILSGIATGKAEVVQTLLDNGADLHKKFFSAYYSFLHSAAEQGHVEMAKLLIQRGLDVNIRNKYKETPLHLAVKAGKTLMVQFLLPKGADIHAKALDARDCKQEVQFGSNITPVFLAVYWNHLDITEILIKAGADVNARTSLNNTALHFAAREGPSEMVKLLLNAGSDVNARSDVSGYTPLMAAVTSGHLDIANILIKAGANVNAEMTHQNVSLHIAVRDGRFGLVRLLLEAGANVNAQMYKGATSLHFAVETNRYEMAQLLLEWKAVIDLKENGTGATPLFFALQKKSDELVKLFIEKGANVNAMNNFGVLPIHVAVYMEKEEIVGILLSKGSYYNVKAQPKTSQLEYSGLPLELAQKSQSSNLVAMLTLIGKFLSAVMKNDLPNIKSCIQAGAIINARDVSGQTALQYVVSSSNGEAINILLANNADMTLVSSEGNSPLHIAVQNGNPEIIKILLTHAEKLSTLTRNSIINAKTTEGSNSALHIAAKNNDLGSVKLLIANGAVFNVKNKSDKLPVQLTTDKTIQSLFLSLEKCFQAIKKEDDLTEVMQCLKDDHSAVNARDNDGGGTLLYWAVAKSLADVVKLLLSVGADYRLATSKGTTPLHIAALKGNLEFVKALVKSAQADNPENTNQFINVATASGTVALHVASSLEVVQCLLQAGAKYNIRNGEGKTALELSRNEDVRRFLRTTHQIFEDVKNGVTSVINTWNSLKNDEFKAITGARNEQGKTLPQVAHVKIASKLRKKLKTVI